MIDEETLKIDDLTTVGVPSAVTVQEPCQACGGCGQVANDDDSTPWVHWLSLPVGSSMSVLMGLVRPIPCPRCHRSGIALRGEDGKTL